MVSGRCWQELSPELIFGKPEIHHTMTSITILAVDDEPAVLRYIIAVLDAMGIQILSATSGLEATQLMNQLGGRIQLLITDVQMPAMGGVQISRNARRFSPTMKTLYLSGRDELDDSLADELNHFGARFLAKPCSPTDLYSTVETLLGEIRFPARGGSWIQNTETVSGG